MSSDSSQNKNLRVVVTGSSGLIGTALVAALRTAGHPVTTLVRRAPKSPDEKQWDPAAGTIDASALDGAWAVVHLAGRGIGDAKWSAEHQAQVLESRVQGTTLLARTIAACTIKPQVFACGSAVGFYGDRGTETLSDDATAGTGFLADVVQAWEASAKAAADAGVRTALLRTGIVMSTTGGALGKQLLPFKLGLGGRLGPGTQYLPWIEIGDYVRAVMHVLHTPSLIGPVNMVGPNPATNSAFTKALGKVLKRPTLIPTPLAPLKVAFGAEMVKEMLLSSSRVVPNKLTASGFVFEHPNLDEALTHLIRTKS